MLAPTEIPAPQTVASTTAAYIRRFSMLSVLALDNVATAMMAIRARPTDALPAHVCTSSTQVAEHALGSPIKHHVTAGEPSRGLVRTASVRAIAHHSVRVSATMGTHAQPIHVATVSVLTRLIPNARVSASVNLTGWCVTAEEPRLEPVRITNAKVPATNARAPAMAGPARTGSVMVVTILHLAFRNLRLGSHFSRKGNSPTFRMRTS